MKKYISVLSLFVCATAFAEHHEAASVVKVEQVKGATSEAEPAQVAVLEDQETSEEAVVVETSRTVVRIAPQKPQVYNNYYMGMRLGYAYQDFDVDGFKDEMGAMLAHFNVGKVISPKVTLGLNFFSTLEVPQEDRSVNVGGNVFSDDASLILRGVSFTGEYAFYKQTFVRAGLGFSTSSLEVGDETLKVIANSDPGFMSELSVGHLFRIERSFALAPYIESSYHRIEGGNSWVHGGGLDLRLYF